MCEVLLRFLVNKLFLLNTNQVDPNSVIIHFLFTAYSCSLRSFFLVLADLESIFSLVIFSLFFVSL